MCDEWLRVLLTVRDPGRADIWDGSGGKKTDVGHPSESTSRTHNNPVDAFHGRGWPSRRSYCDHGWRTVAMLWKLHVSQAYLRSVADLWWNVSQAMHNCCDVCKGFCGQWRKVTFSAITRYGENDFRGWYRGVGTGASGGRAPSLVRTVSPDEYTDYHENVLQSHRHKQLNTQLQVKYNRVYWGARRGNLAAQNARKPFGGRGCALDPLGSLERYPRLASWWGGGWLPPPKNFTPALDPSGLELRSFGPRLFCSPTPNVCPLSDPHLVQAGDAPGLIRDNVRMMLIIIQSRIRTDLNLWITMLCYRKYRVS